MSPRSTRRWLIAVGAVALLVGLLAVTGGLRAAGPRLGPERTPGERVVGHRWAVTVHEATITQRSETSPVQATLALTVTNVTDDHLGYLTQGLVTVVLPDGSQHRESYVSEPGNGFGNPGFPTPVEMRIDLPPQPPGEVPLIVVLRDERDVGSFVTAERWTPTAVLGHVSLTAQDAR